MTDETFAPGEFLCRKDAATYVREQWGRRCSPGLLNKFATEGGGPVYRKMGPRHVVYSKSDLDAWCRAQLGKPVRSTAEAVTRGGKQAVA